MRIALQKSVQELFGGAAPVTRPRPQPPPPAATPTQTSTKDAPRRNDEPQQGIPAVFTASIKSHKTKVARTLI